jgi:hypothetical protein
MAFNEDLYLAETPAAREAIAPRESVWLGATGQILKNLWDRVFRRYGGIFHESLQYPT